MQQQTYQQPMTRPTYPAPQQGWMPAQPAVPQPQGGYPRYQQPPQQSAPNYGYSTAPAPQPQYQQQYQPQYQSAQPQSTPRDNPWTTGGAMPQPRGYQPQQQSGNVWSSAQGNVQPGYQQPRFRPLDEDKEQQTYTTPQYVAPYDRIQGSSRHPGQQPGAVAPYGGYPQGYGYGTAPPYIHPGAPYPGRVW